MLALSQAENFWQEKYDVVSQLMANCPLRTNIDISNSVANFNLNKYISQVSCFRFGWMNPWWSAKLGGNCEPEYLFPEARVARSQDLPPLYCPTGAIWIAETEALKKYKSFYTPHHAFFPIPWISAMDIDDQEDMNMAKACFLIKNMRE